MRSPAWIAAFAMLAGACLDAPTPGEISVELSSPHTDDGAVLFVVHAAAPSEITGITGACAGCLAFMHAVSEVEVRAIVTGPLVAGAIARLQVANAGPTSAFRIEVVQAAGRDHEPRSAADYSVRLVR